MVATSTAACLFVPVDALAQVAAPTISDGDTAWLLTSTALVLFMTVPGLALFYGGLVRAQNVLSVLMQCFAVSCLAAVLWLAGVYSLSFDNGGGAERWIGGMGKALLNGVGADSVSGSIPETLFFMFQMTFAIITPGLIIGAYVERIRFPAVLMFSGLWLILVYAPVTHWVWGGGWLADMGVRDFAGGLVVHVTAGCSALVVVAMLGNRRGFPNDVKPPHNPGMTMIGASMLWVGWFGFNAGSALAANGSAAMAMTVTQISAASASLAWMTIEWIRFGKPSMVGLVTGTIAGLATITPASGFVGPAGALIIGVIAGVVCFGAVQVVKPIFKLDDTLDVFAVHGMGGIVGTLLTGALAVPFLGGVGLPEGMTVGQSVWTQVVGIAATAAWAVAVSFVILKAVDATVGLRVSDEEEFEGLDISTHGERGYEI
ncbi:MAG: ammonium transporter [Rhodospirillales bacterium]|nr:ammonium transporter [Rhodospirillales bacterium]